MIVLITLVHLGLYGAVHQVAMHDFTSNQACEAAAAAIKASDNTVETYCVPK